MKDKITQREFIIQEIVKTGKVTRNFALRNYISRLGAIICNLEKDGYKFSGEYQKVDTPFGSGKDYVYTALQGTVERLKQDYNL